MASTLNFKTDQPPAKLTPAGHTKIATSINQTAIKSYIRSGSGSLKNQNLTPVSTNIYIHAAAPTEPAGDGSINTTDFTGLSATLYSAAAGNYIKSFTSETSFFTADKDFDNEEAIWTITYVAYYSGTPTEGYTPYVKFQFYKRDSSNVDTSLFSVRPTISTLVSEQSYSFRPRGSVTTS
ncbi:hypothetical protein M0R04_11000, partial [Candidatus Dojkabacteria bacterium]|nr:hypothetical protein [Candidatus Dojkabacteria bacterium]